MNHLHSRVAISGIFFLHGLCFSTWGSRIPAIQERLSLSEAQLGSLLLMIPIGSIASMPLATRLTQTWGTKRTLITSIVAYASMLAALGTATTVPGLSVLLVFFGLSSNLVNVSLNSQASELEGLFQRPIMSSLHGLWSLAGFVAAGVGALMIEAQIVPFQHFLLVMLFVMTGAALSAKDLLPSSRSTSRGERSPFRWPDRSLVVLGVLAFCSMICEGAMFDWSGIYFKKVVGAEGGLVSAGYVAFMSTMAGTRFFADRFKESFGVRRTLEVSGALIFSGLTVTVVFPTFGPSLLAFFMVGAGVSAVVPLAFSEAGRLSHTSAPAAIAAVSTMGFFGFLLGPPMIGWIAGLHGLRTSFMVVALMGLMITLLSPKIRPGEGRR